MNIFTDSQVKKKKISTERKKDSRGKEGRKDVLKDVLKDGKKKEKKLSFLGEKKGTSFSSNINTNTKAKRQQVVSCE